ncbi:hypothetical protein QAD02_010765 [Eretmocerus hayati]|uniref:Uncharacterized protein n=1 Tax=Eretmocerus hayati TaxID=131215 RepID=A0ACC2NUQ3_9HYME|nr:hypothetical protein QAD02_010765 [Eretmocerus hayati]
MKGPSDDILNLLEENEAVFYSIKAADKRSSEALAEMILIYQNSSQLGDAQMSTLASLNSLLSTFQGTMVEYVNDFESILTKAFKNVYKMRMEALAKCDRLYQQLIMHEEIQNSETFLQESHEYHLTTKKNIMKISKSEQDILDMRSAMLKEKDKIAEKLEMMLRRLKTHIKTSKKNIIVGSP